jgi:hypothetical protein
MLSPGQVMVVALCCVASSCRCDPPTINPVAPRLVVTPQPLVFAPTFLGSRARASLSVRNAGDARADVTVSVAAPFSTSLVSLFVGAGDEQQLEVVFTPASEGIATGQLTLDALTVELSGEGLRVPQCVASSVCVDTRFEPERSRCVEAPKPLGTACETNCVRGGCANGVCEGVLKACDDSDACTIDACSEADGCSTTLRECPAPSPCTVGVCTATTGCSLEPAPDGTLCGRDDCLSDRVDLCLNGVCTQRMRPETAQCSNRWVPLDEAIGPTVFDVARDRVVLFSDTLGTTAETWEWDRTSWRQRFPVDAPSARTGHALAYDAARRRVVLFGGSNVTGVLADTWEWDGMTWTRRVSTLSPPARAGHAMTYDPVKRVVVLFGGSSTAAARLHDDTWEWNGREWSERITANRPQGRVDHGLAYDSNRRRVVLFGGTAEKLTQGVTFFEPVAQTWELDGTNWVARTLPLEPAPRAHPLLAYDAVRRRVVLRAGDVRAGVLAPDTWEFDGARWVKLDDAAAPAFERVSSAVWDATRQRVTVFTPSGGVWTFDGQAWRRVPPTVPGFAYGDASDLTWDSARGLVVAVGIGRTSRVTETWEFDGTSWSQRSPALAPPARYGRRLAFDSARRRVMAFGGAVSGSFRAPTSDLWEWDGTTWIERTFTGPPPRNAFALAYDEARRRLVMFGGSVSQVRLGDTWEFDGATWTQAFPATAPSERAFHAMAWDARRQRVVLVGGENATGTWEWDGQNWALRPSAVMPPSVAAAMAYDASRQRLVLVTEPPNPIQTWEWDGTNWAQAMVRAAPRGAQAMAYDALRQRLTLSTGASTWLFLP